MLSRRALVGKLAAGAAVAWTSNIGTAKVASARSAAGQPVELGLSDHGLDPASIASRDSNAGALGSLVEASAANAVPAPWDLIYPLRVGASVAHGWQVAGLSPVMDGSCVLTLQNERGRTHRVHLCRNDGRPQGLVYTDQIDLLVMNGGQGDLPTDEGLAQAVAEVAHVLAANEGKRHQQLVTVALLPHAERIRMFADTADARLR